MHKPVSLTGKAVSGLISARGFLSFCGLSLLRRLIKLVIITTQQSLEEFQALQIQIPR